MNRENYQRVKEIFQAVLELAPDERRPHLDRVCTDDPALRGEVERLLDSHDSGYLERPAVESFAAEIAGVGHAAGDMVGHYRIVEKIGSGGMGDVFLAEDVELGRLAALKFLTVELADDEEHLRRFVREAKAASALNHPNIMTVYEIGEVNGSRYIAAEYIRGENLRRHMKGGPLDPAETLRIAVQIAAGLEAAHEAGIIHRDIKPDNVMIRDDGLIKVLDFGLAKHASRSDADVQLSNHTEPGTAIGTIAYMSPEQTQGKALDARTDLWSLGVVLSEMLTGVQPFGGESKADTIAMILREDPAALAESIPNELRRIVAKCLEKKTDDRYQTASELLHDLNTSKDEKGLSVPRPAYLTSRISNYKRSFAAALAVLLFAAIGFGYWFVAIRSATAKQIDSIAVMPFVNDSGNPDAEYLSDGMTETLISSLSRVSGLNVKAREAVFRYKGKGKDAQTIGKELNVQAILNGRFSQRGDQITLTVELMDAQTENVIWSEQYSRKQIDLITLQGEIARSVSAKLRSGLSASEVAKVTKKPSDDLEAYKYYMLGQFYVKKRDPENLKKAVVQFNAAIEKDPNYALAYVGLAGAYALMPEIMMARTSETSPQAREYVNRALQIDDSLAEAHTALAGIEMNEWNWEASEREYKRAIELNPNYPGAHSQYSRLLRYTGRLDEGLAEIKRASELDPMNLVILANVAQAYMSHGDLDLAVEQAQKIIEMDPGFYGGHMVLADAYFSQGRIDEAIAEARILVEMLQRRGGALAMLGAFQAKAGNLTEARAIVKELEERSAKGEDTESWIAFIYAQLGDNDKAFYWLEAAFQKHSTSMGALRVEPAFESLRSDPRFNDLLRRVGLPE